MTRIAGRVINAGVGKETTPGTIVAPSYWLPNTEITFDDKVQKAENIESLGVIDKLNNAHIVKQWAAGSIKGIVHRSSFGMILAGLVGQTSSDTTVETTAKKHTFTVAQNNQHLSLTLAKKDPNLDLRFALARVDSLKVDYVTDNYVMYEAGFMSKKSATASNTVALTTETEFLPTHVVFKNAAVGVSNLGAATGLTNIKSISLETKKNLKETVGLGTADLENIVNTDLEVSGKIERYYDDTTFKDYVFNQTHRSMRIDLIDTTSTVGASTNPSLRFDFDEVVFTDWSENMNDADVVVETITFKAIRNASSGKTISTIELVNDIASY